MQKELSRSENFLGCGSSFFFAGKAKIDKHNNKNPHKCNSL